MLSDTVLNLQHAVSTLESSGQLSYGRALACDVQQDKVLNILSNMERRLNTLETAQPAFNSYVAELVRLKYEADPPDHDVISMEEKRASEVFSEDAKLPLYSPNIAFAAGLGHPFLLNVRSCQPQWSPPWRMFPLKVFRGPDFTYVKIQSHWDDEALLRELNKTYNNLRRFWRRWFSLRSVR